jgi:hypothetical protein
LKPDGQEAKSITIDFDFQYLGDCDLQVSMMGIHSGVRWTHELGFLSAFLKRLGVSKTTMQVLKVCTAFENS